MTGGIAQIHIKAIKPNPRQPRKEFDADELHGLAESIKEHGLVQPIVVEEARNGFVLVSGERRLRAHQLLGRTSIDAVVRQRTNHDGRELLLSAIVENVQRTDMNPIETAQAYAGLRDDYGMKVGEIAAKVGKSPTQVYASLKLLEAELEIQRLWAARKITHEGRAVDAVLSVPAGEERVALVMGLATRRATAKMIVAACARWNEIRKPARKNAPTPAIGKARQIQQKLPEWNALFQVGKVPPWPVVNDVVTATCDRCALRPQASEAICGSCPMVNMLQGLLERLDDAG